jgi:hypothetical protein
MGGEFVVKLQGFSAKHWFFRKNLANYNGI